MLGCKYFISQTMLLGETICVCVCVLRLLLVCGGCGAVVVVVLACWNAEEQR